MSTGLFNAMKKIENYVVWHVHVSRMDKKLKEDKKRKWKKTSMMTGATSVHKSSLEN